MLSREQFEQKVRKGEYAIPRAQIAIDYASNFWSNTAQATYSHEMTHWILFTQTNYGLYLSFLAKLVYEKSVRKKYAETTSYLFEKLFDNQFKTQEGLAVLIMIRSIRADTGESGAEAAVKSLPSEYQEAYKILEFSISLDDTLFDKFTAFISSAAMNTDIFNDLINMTKIEDMVALGKYFSDMQNNPDLRLQKLAEFIQENPKALNLEAQEICKQAGLTFHTPLNVEQRVKMLNFLLSLTDIEERFDEETIVNRETKNLFEPLIQHTVVSNLNLNLAQARVVLDLKGITAIENQIEACFMHDESSYFKEAKTELRQLSDRNTTVVFFLKDGGKIWSPIRISEFIKTSLVTDFNITKIADNTICDYDDDSIKPLYRELNPNVIIYRSFNELRLLLDCIDKHNLRFYFLSSAFTEGHHFWTFIFRIEGRQLLHILTNIPSVNKYILESKPFQKGLQISDKSLANIVGDQNGKHYTNYHKVWLGMDPRVDWFELAKDAQAYLPILTKSLRDD